MKLWQVHTSTVDGGLEPMVFFGHVFVRYLMFLLRTWTYLIYPIRMPLRALRAKYHRQSNGRCKVCWTWRNRVNFNCWRRQRQRKSCHSFPGQRFFFAVRGKEGFMIYRSVEISWKLDFKYLCSKKCELKLKCWINYDSNLFCQVFPVPRKSNL